MRSATVNGDRVAENLLQEPSDPMLDEVRNAQAELAELARMAAQLGAMLAGNASASQREQGVRDLIDAVARVSGRSNFRLDEIAATYRRVARGD